MARKAGLIRLASKPTIKPAPWVPQTWQVDPFHDRESRIVLLTGSAGGGKSALALAKAHQVCLSYPGVFCLVIRKTRESMTSGSALFLESEIINGQATHKKYESSFVYANGSRIKYSGMATPREATRLKSVGRKGGVEFIVIDEATELTSDDFDILRSRLRGPMMPWRQIVLATNPDAPSHWIYQRLIEGGGASVYYSSAADNAYLPEGYEDDLNQLSGVMYDRMAKGLWVSAQGVVHSNWNPDVNLVKRFQIPDDWTLVGSIDFGFENPTCVQWWAVDGDKRMYLYREVYATRMPVNDLADIIKAQDDHGRVRWVADHSASDRATLARAGITTKPANKGVERGLTSVNHRLRVQGDGKPRMMLFEDALMATDSRLKRKHFPASTAQEFPQYVWDKRLDGAILDRPLKQHDHGMDAARYAAVFVDRMPTWVAV